MGDCARKYERMGELPGEGRPAEFPEGEEGVGGNSELELAEPDEPEESEPERTLPLPIAIGIGSECFVVSVGILLADILC